MSIDIRLLIFEFLKLLTSPYFMHFLVFLSFIDQMLMNALLISLLWGSTSLGFVKCLSIVLFNCLSILLHVLLILLLSQKQILYCSFLCSLLAYQQWLKSTFFSCLLLESFLYKQILLFLLIKWVQIQHIMYTSIFTFSSLSFLANFSWLWIYLRNEGQVLSFLGLFFHLLCVNFIVKTNFRVD